ncbi:hypothetical protein QAD02_002261 [Eretmocerus hayati]|uniref:Uncharacterized protein n=1 Tax=Eretmocerus hayati TaxID=131215 RepID=A0ACC2NIS0_9HYME|nr:hypothetical protein QAD02_002261 [Eretmocerus hayati]
MSFRKPYPNLSPSQQKRRIRQLRGNDLRRIAMRVNFEQINLIPIIDISHKPVASASNDERRLSIEPAESHSNRYETDENDHPSSVDLQQSNLIHNEASSVSEEPGSEPPDRSDQSDSDRDRGDQTDDSDSSEGLDSDAESTDPSTDPGSSTDSDSGEEEEEFDLKSFLREWTLTNSITLCATSKLLSGLREAGHGDLPKDARTLLQTPTTSAQLKSIGSGSYAHYGLLKAILELFARVSQRLIPRILLLTVHVDGVKISKSSGSELYTILGDISNCEVFTDPFVIGAHHGAGKPENVHEFMRDFLTELTDLRDNGFVYNYITYRVILEKISADTPAKFFY